MITKLNFQDWINKANHFQDWGPKYGIAYLRVLEISQNKVQILSQTNDYPDLPTLLGQMQHIRNNSPTCYLCNHLNSVLVRF